MSEKIVERIYPKELLVDDPDVQMHLSRYALAAEVVAQVASTRRRRAIVFDLGCGVGYGSAHVVTRAPAFVYGVDNSAEAIEYARREHALPGVHFIVADVCSWAPPARADVAVLFELLEHLVDPDALVARLPGVGVRTLIASVPLRDPPEHNPFHRHAFSVDALEKLVRPHFPEVRTHLQQLGEAPCLSSDREATAFHALVVASR